MIFLRRVANFEIFNFLRNDQTAQERLEKLRVLTVSYEQAIWASKLNQFLIFLFRVIWE
jgi:hypothetical protein